MGRVFRRRLEQARQHRGLGEGDVLHRLAEVEFRRRLNAESAAAHIDAVEIKLQNLALGEMVLQPERQKGLVDLAGDGALVGEEQIFGELLRDRRAALHHAGRAGVHRERAQRADDVDAEMFVEAAVLGGQHGLDEIVGILVERHGVVMLDAALADLIAVAIQEGDGEIALLEPVALAGHLKGRTGQRRHDDQADETEGQRLAGELHAEPGETRDVEPLHEGGEILVHLARAPAAVEQARIDERVRRQQNAPDALDERRGPETLEQGSSTPWPPDKKAARNSSTI